MSTLTDKIAELTEDHSLAEILSTLAVHCQVEEDRAREQENWEMAAEARYAMWKLKDLAEMKIL